MRKLASVVLAFTIGTMARTASAQEIRGRVTDAASGAGVSSAVLQLLDSAKAVIGRNISNERGDYRLSVAGLGQHTRFITLVRIGFRPLEISIAVPDSGLVTVNVRMTPLPTMLEPVHVVDQPNCPRRNDRNAAFSLWEQARTGLLATIVAREANPGSMVRIAYHRQLDDDGNAAISQNVRVDSTDQSRAGFVATRTAEEFVRLGFMDDHKDAKVFHGPDAEAILSDDFLTGYCLHVVSSNASRPNQVGLGFAAANHKRDRIDIDGTVWIDTTARSLKEIEFKYVGFDRRLEQLHPGGRMEFQEMPNGVVLLYRWNLRLVGAESNVAFTRNGIPFTSFSPYAQDGGGELARVVWPDGATWHASLGTVRIHATNPDGSPAAGKDIRLENSDYRAVTDSAGNAQILSVLPGSYMIMIYDPLLSPISVAIRSGVVATAARDSTSVASISISTAEAAVQDQCLERQHAAPEEFPWLLVRVITPAGQPVGGITLIARMETSLGNWVTIRDSGTTGSDGLFGFCRFLDASANVVVQARRGDQRADVPIRLNGDLTVAPIVFPNKP